MRRTRNLHGGLWTASVFFLCVGCGPASAPKASTPSAGDDWVTVKTVTPLRTTLKRTTTQPATVHANHQAELYAKVAGYLTELNTDIGQKVEENAVLGVIDVPELVKAREVQEASIRRLIEYEARAMANLRLAKANVQAAEATRNQAQADIKKTDAQLTSDQANFDRVEKLVAAKSVAAKLLDEARKQLEASQASKASSRAAFDSTKANVLVANEKLAVAIADQGAAKAESEVARKQLEVMDARMSFATLRAPFKGVVTERHVDLGDLVRNIQTASENQRRPLFTVAQLDKVRIQVAVPENDTPFANEGDPATFKSRALQGRVFEGKVNRVASMLDESTRTMLVEVDLDSPDFVLLPGMYGEATIVLEVKTDTLVLPAGAVHYDKDGGSFVYVVSESAKVQIVEVRTGFDDGKQIEITNGIDENTSVVDALIGRLHEDQQVRVEGK